MATFRRLVQHLNDAEAEYVVIGGIAVILHGVPRLTEDIDFFVKTTAENIDRVKAALRTMYQDPSVDDITFEDVEAGVVRYGPPEGDYVIDVLGRLGEAWCYEDLESETIDVGGTSVRIATPRTLIRMKHNTVRAKDHLDAEYLAEKFNIEEI